MNILYFKQIYQSSALVITLISVLLLCNACSWNETYIPAQSNNSPTNQQQTPSVVESNTVTQNQQTTNSKIVSLSDEQQQKIVQTALNQLNTPYRYGGNNPSGFDCSGLVQYSYSNIGITVPRSTRDQVNFFTQIPRSELQAGDLVFFKIAPSQQHVAIMINAHDFVHAPSSGKTVSTSNLSNPYWNAKFFKATRYY